MTITALPGQLTDADEAATQGKSGKGGKGKGGKKKGVTIVAVLLLAAAAYFLVFAPGSGAAPEPGEVVQLEPIQVNLLDGHYLKLGLALQLTATAKEADGSKALDAAIDLFSGRDMDELTQPVSRARLKAQLRKELGHRYEGAVMDVYFTDFVTQ
jgi:flagellar FliL protein